MHLRLAALSITLPPLLAAAAAAQAVAPGHRLYSPRPGTDTHLVDNEGAIVHTWPSAYAVGLSAYLREDGHLLRAILTNTNVPARALSGGGGGVQLQSFDGSVLWDWRYDTGGVLQHHDIEPLPNGNVLVIAWEEKTVAEALAAGRDPALIDGTSFPDHVVEVQPTGPTTGQIVWEWHAWDHLIQDLDPTKANFGVVADHPEKIDLNYPPNRVGGELHHLNGIDYDPVNDWIVLSAHTQDEVWVIDHSTTTAEAAGSTGGARGKGGDLLYRWGNPAAYDRGTAAEQTLYKQHSPKFVPLAYPGGGHMTIFSNQAPGGSEVVEIELPLDAGGNFVDPGASAWGPAAPVWTYSDAAFQSLFMSSAERLPNGNTLICSSLQGRIFEVDDAGALLWEHAVPSGIQSASFHATYYERTLWADRDVVSAAAGGTITFDVVAGSRFAGDAYLLTGSLAGTSPGFSLHGFHVPLNPDAYFRYTLGAPAGPYHTDIVGNLDASGAARITFDIPPGLAPAGLTLDHVVLAAHPTRLRLRGVSNVETTSTIP